MTAHNPQAPLLDRALLDARARGRVVLWKPRGKVGMQADGTLALSKGRFSTRPADPLCTFAPGVGEEEPVKTGELVRAWVSKRVSDGLYYCVGNPMWDRSLIAAYRWADPPNSRHHQDLVNVPVLVNADGTVVIDESRLPKAAP